MINLSALNQCETSNDACSYLTNQINNKKIKQVQLNSLIHQAVCDNYPNAYLYLLFYFKDNSSLSIKQAQKSISSDGKTLLHEAVLAQNVKLYQKLLANRERLINPFIRDKNGCTAADYAYLQAIENPRAEEILETAIYEHTAIDVTWLKLPPNINIESALMVGHIVQKNSQKNHLYDKNSVQKALNNGKLLDKEPTIIADRIAQFLQISPDSELKNVNKILQEISAILPSPTIANEISKNNNEINIVEIDENSIEIDLHQINPENLTQKDFITQIEHLQKALQSIQESFLSLSPRNVLSSDEINKVNSSLSFCQLLPSFLCALFVVYNFFLAMVALVAVIPEKDFNDCLQYEDLNGHPVCVDFGYYTGFSSEDWDNMEDAAIYPNAIFVASIILTSLLAFCVKPVVRSIRIGLEDYREQRNINNLEKMLKTLLAQMTKSFPELRGLYESAQIPVQDAPVSIVGASVGFEETKLSSAKVTAASEKINVLGVVLKEQIENILPQSNSLTFYPALNNLGIFKLTKQPNSNLQFTPAVPNEQTPLSESFIIN